MRDNSFEMRCAEYNYKLLRRPALEEWGTERWLSALVAEAKREVSKLETRVENPAPRVKVKVTRRDRDSLSPQRCVACETKIEAGDVWAHPTFPAVLCLACAASRFGKRTPRTTGEVVEFEMARVG